MRWIEQLSSGIGVRGMPKRRKKSEGVDILSFLSPSRERAPRSELTGSCKARIVAFISKQGGVVRKSELYSWALRDGLTPAQLYKALSELLRDKHVTRAFDEASEEVVYTLVSS